jgi:hypothetical protein
MQMSDRSTNGRFVRRLAFAAATLCAFLTAAQGGENKSVVTDLDKMMRIHPEYPIPNEPNQLFYVERSSNSNTVIYCAKLDAKGQLDSKTPVVAYWRWYHRGGYIKQLNLPERMLAYGIKSVKRDGPSGSYSFQIAAFPDRIIHVSLDKNGRPEAFGKSGKRWGKIEYIYLLVDDSGILPKVPEADLLAYDRETGKPFREHLTLQ